MKNIPAKTQRGSVHLFTVLALGILLTTALGFFFWNSTKKESVERSNPYAGLATAECIKKIDAENSSLPRITDTDYSDCYPDMIDRDSLTQKQKDEHQRNSVVFKKAVEAKDDRVCAQVKGVRYSSYPPNLTKVTISTEEETRQSCVWFVKHAIDDDARRVERLRHYFELPEWDIKLEWRDESDEVKYYPTEFDSKGVPTTYEFTTKNTEERGDCPLYKNGRIGAITRARSPQRSPGEGTYLRTIIGDYHYYDIKPRMLCIADDEILPSAINQTRILIRSMITGVQSQPYEESN